MKLRIRLFFGKVSVYKIVNIVKDTLILNLNIKNLEKIGYKFVVSPLTVLSLSMSEMIKSLCKLKLDKHRNNYLLNFLKINDVVGFNNYYVKSSKYNTSNRY